MDSENTSALITLFNVMIGIMGIYAVIALGRIWMYTKKTAIETERAANIMYKAISAMRDTQ